VREISVKEVVQVLERPSKAVLVDVREDGEWNAGHAQGAIHLGKGILERDIEKTIPDPSTRVILYCGGGFRSALAAEAIQKMGYTDVWSMAGGWTAWLEAGLPTTSK
jgi:rhodanese-related sulfurtransferase